MCVLALPPAELRRCASRDGQSDWYSSPRPGFLSWLHAGFGTVFGWHMLNQARLALVGAEACKVFYEEVEVNPTEALYRCQYLLS